MNDSERIALQVLTGLEMGDVLYEPDGNTRPDFLIDDRIAVESRRSNKHVQFDGTYRGLEEASKPLYSLVTRILAATGSQSWLVWYTVRRSL